MNKKTEGASHHAPVLLGPAIAGLNLKTEGWYVDGTFGRGGHTSAILEALGPEGRLVAIDRDAQAFAETPMALRRDTRLEFVHGNFSELRRYANERNLLATVDGLLLDLGVSSPQLDEAERGFSFRADGPLDMRMDQTRGVSAADWLVSVDEKKLTKVLKELGEERFARRISRAIVAARESAPIRRTSELADIVRSAVPVRGNKRHPATRTFQAIRIYINNELDAIADALDASVDLLRPGGRLCVISFHSLEDRLVKRFMREASSEREPYRGLPNVPEAYRPTMKVIGKAISPADEEIAMNARARSAHLRIAERL